MDFESLQAAWRSAANNPSAAANEYLVREASATLARRRAHLRGLLAFAAVMLAIPLGLMAVDIVTGQSDPINLNREWGLIPFALIPIVVLVFIARRHGVHMRRYGANVTLLETFRALRDDNAAARTRIYMIAGAMLGFAPLLGVLLHQLAATGKMAPHEMTSAAFVLGGGLAIGAVWMAVKYATQLLPERRQLDELVRQYETDGGSS